MVDVLQLNQWNLMLQLAVTALFVIAIVLWKMKLIRNHGLVMTGAYVLNLVSTLLIMLPLFLRGWSVVSHYEDGLAILFVVHHLIGLVAIILATLLILRFVRGSLTIRYCRGRWLMRATALTWSIALVLGLYLYRVGYFPG